MVRIQRVELCEVTAHNIKEEAQRAMHRNGGRLPRIYVAALREWAELDSDQHKVYGFRGSTIPFVGKQLLRETS